MSKILWLSYISKFGMLWNTDSWKLYGVTAQLKLNTWVWAGMCASACGMTLEKLAADLLVEVLGSNKELKMVQLGCPHNYTGGLISKQQS